MMPTGQSKSFGQWSESHCTTAVADRMVTRPVAHRSNQVLEPVASRARVDVAICLAAA